MCTLKDVCNLSGIRPKSSGFDPTGVIGIDLAVYDTSPTTIETDINDNAEIR